jgi:uncharacterized membrane protein
MEGAIGLALALLAIPFVLPLISWIMARRVRQRVDELEERIVQQDERITRLTNQLTQLKKEGAAPARPPVTAPPPVMVTPPVVPAPAATPPVTSAAPPPLPVIAAPPPPARPAPPIEPPPPSRSFDWEQFVGVRLFSAIAGIALVFAAVFFLRYSIEQGLLQPPVRVMIGIVVAISLLVVCDRKAARKYPVTANAMDAAAIAILFSTFFAAHSLWNLISGGVAFALLGLVTLTAVMLSIRRDSLFIAVLGLLGGFATPILLSTGENRPIPLFGYCSCSTSASRGSPIATAGSSSARSRW